MSDNKAGPSFHQVIHSALYPFLGPGIHRGSGFIQDQDLIVCQDCSGNGKKLFLSLGNVIGLLIQDHLITARLGHDKVVDMGCLGCGDDFFICGVQPSIPDIFHNSSVEQPGILEHHAEHFPQFASVKVFYIVAVNQDLPGIYIIKPHEQLDHGGLSRSCRTYDSHFLSFLNLHVEIMDDHMTWIITKGHMAGFHISI